MQTGSSVTLTGWKSGKITFVPPNGGSVAMYSAVNFECKLSITGYKIYTEIPTGPPNNKNIVKCLSRKNIQLYINEKNPGSLPPFSISHPPTDS
jgi:hypothetical protein